MDKEKILEKTNFKCGYCGVQLNTTLNASSNFLNVDHIFPVRLGGGNHKNNFMASCRMCNQRKNHKTIDEFRDWVEIKQNKKSYQFYFEKINLPIPNINELLKIKKELRSDINNFKKALNLYKMENTK